MITLSCGHTLETSAPIGSLVFCPLCRCEAEVREISASLSPATLYGSFSDGPGRIDILYNAEGIFGFAVRVLGIRVEQWGFADPTSALEEARAICASAGRER